MEIYDNLLNYSKEFIKNEFISEDTSIEELIYLKYIIEERINEIINFLYNQYKEDKENK